MKRRSFFKVEGHTLSEQHSSIEAVGLKINQYMEYCCNLNTQHTAGKGSFPVYLLQGVNVNVYSPPAVKEN